MSALPMESFIGTWVRCCVLMSWSIELVMPDSNQIALRII